MIPIKVVFARPVLLEGKPWLSIYGLCWDPWICLFHHFLFQCRCDRFQSRAGYCLWHADVYLERAVETAEDGDHEYDEIPFEDIELEEVIGSGAFGAVYRAKLWGQHVAVKMLRSSKNVDQDQIQQIVQEASIMRSLRHANIVQFMGVARAKNSPRRIAIVTELMEGGNLDAFLDKHQKLSWKRYFDVAKVWTRC